jgi:mycothiol synthase
MMKTETLPGGFTVRHPVMDDLEAVTEMINACCIAIDGEPDMSSDDLRHHWETPGFNMTTDEWLVLSPEGQIVGCAGVEHLQHTRLFTDVYVHPAHQGQGIEAYLLSQAEQRAMQHIPESVPGARVTLNTAASNKETELLQLFESQGFQYVRGFWRMGIELREMPPMPQWPEGIRVRTLAPGMERALFAIKEETFRDHWGQMPDTFENWAHRTLQSKNFDPSLCFLAMDGDEIVGFARCQDEKELGGWVHTLGVLRAWRRHGLALALLYHAFAEFYHRGITNVYLGVDAQSLTGATRLYERAGMHVVRQYSTYEKELRAGKELSTQAVEV